MWRLFRRLLDSGLLGIGPVMPGALGFMEWNGRFYSLVTFVRSFVFLYGFLSFFYFWLFFDYIIISLRS